MSELRGFCNMCGKCCEAIHLNQSPERIADMAKDNYSINNGDAKFIHENWIPMSQEEAMVINPYLKQNVESYKEKHDGRNPYEHMYFYTCSKFDKETRLCTVHDNLPNVCSGYPWYGRPPRRGELFYADECGYKVDVEDLDKESDSVDNSDSKV